jgi:hypothetical protein
MEDYHSACTSSFDATGSSDGNLNHSQYLLQTCWTGKSLKASVMLPSQNKKFPNELNTWSIYLHCIHSLSYQWGRMDLSLFGDPLKDALHLPVLMCWADSTRRQGSGLSHGQMSHTLKIRSGDVYKSFKGLLTSAGGGDGVHTTRRSPDTNWWDVEGLEAIERGPFFCGCAFDFKALSESESEVTPALAPWLNLNAFAWAVGWPAGWNLPASGC